MKPLLQPPKGDDVIYCVQGGGAGVFSCTLRTEAARKRWRSPQVSLALCAEQLVDRTLILDPSPAGNTTGDPARWGGLQLLPSESARCRLASCLERAAAAWRKGDFPAHDLVRAREAERKVQRHEEALKSYGQAL